MAEAKVMDELAVRFKVEKVSVAPAAMPVVASVPPARVSAAPFKVSEGVVPKGAKVSVPL